MKLTYVKSAGVIVECKGVRVLCDPWLVDGIYYGSWNHYPPLKVKPEDFADVDYIYISHIHPDHLDVNTLARLPKSIPILIHNFAEKFVLNILKKRLEFITVHEVSHNEIFSLCPGFHIEILAADNCNPEICGRYFNCNITTPYTKTTQIDTLAVFHGDHQTLVNCNDCPYGLSKTVCDNILSKYKTVDLLLVGYRGAGPYPQCFENLDLEEKAKEALGHRDKILTQSVDYIRHLKPKAFMPFAGQYVLGGKLANLNQYILPNTEDLHEIFPSLLTANQLDSKMVLMNSMEFYDLTTQLQSSPFIPSYTQERERYMNEVLSKRKFDYEDDLIESPLPDLTDKLNIALQRMRAHQINFGNYTSEWNVYLDVGQDHYYQIPFNMEESISKVEPGNITTPYLKIGLDYPLIIRILNRKAHWNNAEIGSHLRYDRNPNKFERTIHFLMSYFQC